MRIVPIGLLYWRDEALARDYARRSSRATHPSPLCLEMCEMWTGAIATIMAESTRAPKPSAKRFSKLDLLHYISSFPYKTITLRDALAIPSRIRPAPEDDVDREAWYWQHHPLLRLIADTQRPGTVSTKTKGFAYTIPPVKQLPSTGYVLDSAVAALYCFFATSTFEDGALLAVNLGDDADTVGAIFAGLAACWYSAEEGDGDRVFWTTRVKSWCEDLVRRDIIDTVAKDLAAMEYEFNL
uniref:ADP-ribosylhydrolase ARH3 n=2 Tax=Psilocybe cubensis TaxID=181762 RepID=A0A8H7XPK4_PSICU